MRRVESGSVENLEHFNFNMKLTNNVIPLYSH